MSWGYLVLAPELVRSARHQGGLHHARRGDAQHAHRRHRGRARLSRHAARRDQGQDRHHRPQPRRLDRASARRRRVSISPSAAWRAASPTIPAAIRVRQRHRHPGPAAGRRQGRLDAGRPLPAAGRPACASRRSSTRSTIPTPITASTPRRPTAPCPARPARSTTWPTIRSPRPTPRRGRRRSSRSICGDSLERANGVARSVATTSRRPVPSAGRAAPASRRSHGRRDGRPCRSRPAAGSRCSRRRPRC